MADRAWKKAERTAAQIIGGSGRRYWANSGEDIDIENDGIVGQVKNVKTLSFAQLHKLCIEVERQGTQRHKLGLVLAKLRAGRGVETRWIVAMTAETFREMSGPLPGERHEPA